MENIAKIPVIGWITMLTLGVLLIAAIITTVVLVTKFLKGKNVESDVIKITEAQKQEVQKKECEHKQSQRELYMSEGKDQLDNQCQAAKNILKELRIRIFEIGIKKYGFTDKKDYDLFTLITRSISDRLNYEVKNDLTRNHIIFKSDKELTDYSEGKARGYYSLIKDRLYTLNDCLPDVNLPAIMDEIPLLELEKFFKEVYFSARKIAGKYFEDLICQ